MLFRPGPRAGYNTVFSCFKEHFMPTCSAYRINPNNNTWRHNTTETARLGAPVHAEIAVFTVLANDTCHLLVADDFPCVHCHAHFIRASATKSIIVKVTANQGAYSRDHSLPTVIDLPAVIYYHNGTARYSFLNPPANTPTGPHQAAVGQSAFPAHPSVANEVVQMPTRSRRRR